MGRRALALGALLIVAGGGALGYALTRTGDPRPSAEQSGAMASALGQLDGDLRAARASAEQRAKTLAEVDRIRNAVATDAETAMDMVGKEISFKPEPDEVIELVQLPNARPPQSLLILSGAGAAAIGGKGRGATIPGPFSALSGDRLVVGHTVEVVLLDPAKLQEGMKGFITTSRVLELRPALDRLAAAGVTGSFQIGGESRPIGELRDGAATEAKALSSEPDARLVVASPASSPATPRSIVAVGVVVAALGLVIVVIGMLTGKSTPRPPSIQALTTVESRPPGSATQLTATAAAGTPSPTDDPSSSAAINPNNLGPGAMIGRWEVVRRLGSGGMADVYLAHAKGEAGFEKLVAIKVMHAHLARNPRAVDHFLDEARLAARIHHPNVVGIQDLGKIGDDYVIVMDYVEGVDLEHLLMAARTAERPVPIDVGLAILCRICDGLHAAHQATSPDGTALGIIHRDVKCANVLVSRQGGVKVVDFGIAKAATQVHLTLAGETKGTPAMMAPEQRVGDQVDVRADVYSVGAVGYELVTGHGVNLDLAALAHLGVDNWPHLPAPSSLRPSLPAELDPILLRAMAFERDRRPADCAALEAQLETVIKRHGLVASDKDIARWVDGELRLLVPAFQGVTPAIRKPVGA